MRMEQIMDDLTVLDHTVTYYGKAVDDGLVAIEKGRAAIAAYGRLADLQAHEIVRLSAENALLRAQAR